MQGIITLSAAILISSSFLESNERTAAPAVPPAPPPRQAMLLPRTDTPPPGTTVWLTSELPVGMAAPDFTLPDLRSDRPVNLSALRAGRPTVLIFGSFG